MGFVGGWDQLGNGNAALKFNKITEKIMGAAFRVRNVPGCDFQEVIYQRALSWSLSSSR
jgi:hypothetical protein